MPDFLYESINLGDSESESAALISAIGQRSDPSTPTFPNGTNTGDTIVASYFVFLADQSEDPVLSADPQDSSLFTVAGAALAAGPVDLGSVSLYGFDITLTRVLPAGSAGTNQCVPFITLQGRTIVLQPFAVDVEA